MSRLAGMMVVLILGTALRHWGVLNERRTETLNRITYVLALPSLIFVSTFNRSITALMTPSLLFGSLATLFVTFGVAKVIYDRINEPARQSVATVQSYHSNLGYLGFPLVAATFDEEVTAVASLILGVVSLTQVALTIFVLTSINEGNTTIRSEMSQLASNPILFALIAGILIGELSATPPIIIISGLDFAGMFALPLALVCVGASFQIRGIQSDTYLTVSILVIKLALMPIVAAVVFGVLVDNPAVFTAAVVMFATPTAVSTYVFSTELGGDTNFASFNVFVSTFVSIFSLLMIITTVE
jgi:malonate transporter